MTVDLWAGLVEIGERPADASIAIDAPNNVTIVFVGAVEVGRLTAMTLFKATSPPVIDWDEVRRALEAR